MGRGKEHNDGGQRRTIVCGCGWRYTSSPDRINKVVSLHAKKCDIIDVNSFRGLSTKRIYDNAYVPNTPKGTIYKGVQYIEGIPSPIDFTKNNMSDQITTNYEKICTIKEKNEFSC